MRVLTADGDAVDADATDADAADADAADAGASCRITRGSSACASALLMVSTVRRISCCSDADAWATTKRYRRTLRWPENRPPDNQGMPSGLQMKGKRIVDSAFYSGLQKRVPNGFAPCTANHEQVEARFRSLGFRIGRTSSGASISRYVEAITRRRWFHSSSSSAWRAKRRPESCRAVSCNRKSRARNGNPAVIAQLRHAPRDFLVVGRDRSALAPCAKIFTGIKAEASHVAHRSGISIQPAVLTRAPCAWQASSTTRS